MQEFVPAQRGLGILYARGLGVQKNLDEARKWLKKAATNGDIKSRELLDKL